MTVILSCPRITRCSFELGLASLGRLRVTEGVRLAQSIYRSLLRRLLRRHLVDLASLEINPDAVDLVEIGAGYAHEARVVGIVD